MQDLFMLLVFLATLSAILAIAAFIADVILPLLKRG